MGVCPDMAVLEGSLTVPINKVYISYDTEISFIGFDHTYIPALNAT